MRIISDFHDYYDGLQDWQEPIFLRKKQIVEKDERREGETYFYAIGVCGKTYICAEYQGKFYYSEESFKEAKKKQEKRSRPRYYAFKYLDDWPTFEIKSEECLSLWRVRNYWRRCEGTLIEINPTLKNWGFQSVMPIQTLFQEIEMFQCNVVHPDKPLPKIDDVTLAESKGFNKYSFRKDKNV